MIQRRFLAVLAAAACLCASAQAQTSWPDKPVRLLLSQPPGSGPDNIARLLGERLSKAWGQPVIVENKPGGQNVIGAQAAARSVPDGSTFYFATTAALVANAYLFKDLPYNPRKDFAPVGFVGKSPFAIVVDARSPIRTVADLVARARAEPGRVSIGTEGPRTFGGITARTFNARAAVQTNLVSYPSVGVALQDLIGGHVDAAVADVASSAQLVRQGRLRYVAVTSGKRVPGWEQVPPLADTLPGFDMEGWLAVVAPAGTPAAAIERFSRDLDAALKDKELAERIHAIGPRTEGAGTPAQFGAFLQQEHERWAQLSREIGLLPE